MTTVMTITLTFNRSYDSLTIDEKPYTYDGNNKWHFDYNDIFYKKIEGGGGGGSLGGGGGTTKYMNSFQTYRDTLTSMKIELKAQTSDTLNIASTFREFINLTSFIITNTYNNNIYIDTGCFSYCSNLININIPNNINSIPNYCFTLCTSLTNINLPTSITTINEGTFAGCTNLITINVPSNVTLIDKMAFLGCINLQSITFPNNLSQINILAFGGCINLQSITFPNNLSQINSLAFGGCIKLTTIIYNGTSLILDDTDTNTSGIFSNTNINYNQLPFLQNYYNSIADKNIYNKQFINFITFAINNPSQFVENNVYIFLVARNIIQYYNIKDPKKFKNAMNDKQWLMYFFTYYNLQNK